VVGVRDTVDRLTAELGSSDAAARAAAEEVARRQPTQASAEPAEVTVDEQGNVSEDPVEEGLVEELFAVRGEGARSREGDVVVVSHVSPIKAAVAWALGADELVAWRLRLSTGSVTRIDLGPHGPQLVSFNEVPSGL